MPPIVTQSLHLEDTLEEDPQTKAMLNLFEKDALTLKKFSKAFAGACQKILNAQALMISANQELAYYCRLYGEQEFLLQQNKASEPSDEESKQSDLVVTLNKFADHIDEVSTCFQVFTTQLNDTMIYPLNKLVENEFEEINNLSQLYKDRAELQEQAIQKYLRLPNKRDYDLQRHQANEEVFDAKKKFHETSMSYFSSLNILQYKREYMLTEPLISLFQSYKLFFKMGADTLNGSDKDPSDKTLDGFLEKNTDHICSLKNQLAEEMNKNNQMIELLQQDDSIYQAEQPDFSHEDPNRCERLQKCGFLNLRSKFPLIFKWDRIYYFIQNGCLMHQQKSDVAGSVFLELKSDVTVHAIEIDDLKFTFQLTTQFPSKRTCYFQANNERDRNEWITILENAIKDENKTKLQSFINNSRQMAESNLHARISRG